MRRVAKLSKAFELDKRKCRSYCGSIKPRLKDSTWSKVCERTPLRPTNRLTIMCSDIPFKELKRWLLPNDPVVLTLTADHTAQLGERAEFTCEWFQKPLVSFIKEESKVMALTGQAGCGKTVIAASIVERLQRALGRKNFSTLYYRISKFDHSVQQLYSTSL